MKHLQKVHYIMLHNSFRVTVYGRREEVMDGEGLRGGEGITDSG